MIASGSRNPRQRQWEWLEGHYDLCISKGSLTQAVTQPNASNQKGAMENDQGDMTSIL